MKMHLKIKYYIILMIPTSNFRADLYFVKWYFSQAFSFLCADCWRLKLWIVYVQKVDLSAAFNYIIAHSKEKVKSKFETRKTKKSASESLKSS